MASVAVCEAWDGACSETGEVAGVGVVVVDDGGVAVGAIGEGGRGVLDVILDADVSVLPAF